MADIGKMTHAGAGSSSAGDRARAAGYRWRFVAENVAWGQEDAPRVVAGWGASAPHRRNILSKDAKEIGLLGSCIAVGSLSGSLLATNTSL